jgi:hypothetical protein
MEPLSPSEIGRRMKDRARLDQCAPEATLIDDERAVASSSL